MSERTYLCRVHPLGEGSDMVKVIVLHGGYRAGRRAGAFYLHRRTWEQDFLPALQQAPELTIFVQERADPSHELDPASTRRPAPAPAPSEG